MGCCGGRSSGRGRSRKFIKGTKNKSGKRINLKKPLPADSGAESSKLGCKGSTPLRGTDALKE